MIVEVGAAVGMVVVDIFDDLGKAGSTGYYKPQGSCPGPRWQCVRVIFTSTSKEWQSPNDAIVP